MVDSTTKITSIYDDNITYRINEDVSLSDMQEACPRFFRNKHGKYETYKAYRGFLIVRHTVIFDRQKVRKTVIYAFCTLETKPDLYCMCSRAAGTKGAQELIDRMIEEKRACGL